MFIIKLLSEHVSGIIMPIIRRTRVCTAAYGVLHWLCGCVELGRELCALRRLLFGTVTFTVHSATFRLVAPQRAPG